MGSSKMEEVEQIEKMVQQRKFLEELNFAVDIYKSDLLKRGDDGKLKGDEYYQYIKYNVEGKMIIPIYASVKIDKKVYPVGVMVGMFLEGRYADRLFFVGTEPEFINNWMTEKQLQYDFDKKDIHTKGLVLSIKCYVQDLIEDVENGDATERQQWEYNKMMLGEPLEILNTGSEFTYGKRSAENLRLVHRILAAYDKDNSVYEKNILGYMLKKFKIMYKAEDKIALRQKEVLDAICKYKQDIIDRYNEGSLKKREMSTYENIMSGEAIEIPRKLIINTGTEEYPTMFELGDAIRKMSNAILGDKRNLWLNQVEFIDKVIDAGVKLDDDVVDKLNEMKIEEGLVNSK